MNTEIVEESPKRRPGRPRKIQERVVRTKNDPLKRWQAEQELAKAQGDPLVALAEEKLKDEMVVPKGMDPVSKKHYILLHEEFKTLGIDTIRYKRVHMLLAKSYAMEEMCEKELQRIGGIAYKTSGENPIYREHPAAKHLHSTRQLILNLLKSLGLTPSANGATRFEQAHDDESGFGSLQ